MSTNYGRHFIKPQILKTSKKTVYPLPQQLAEKVIKDKGRNAYVVVFDTDETEENPVNRKQVLKTSSRVFNEQNVAQGEDPKTVKQKSSPSEDVKLNFSNLSYEEYDSSKTAVNVFKDDEIEQDIDICIIKQEVDQDEGFNETDTSYFPQTMGKSNEPIAGYMLITPRSDSSDYRESIETPSSKYNISGSSGYFSSSSSGFLSSFNTPSPISTPEHGLQHPVARQIILVPSSGHAGVGIETQPVLPRQYSNISPISSLATGFHNIARIESPTVFSTKKFTGADAFSLPEETLSQRTSSSSSINYCDNVNSSNYTHPSRSINSSSPFQWDHVNNRIVIQPPNKKPLDLTLPSSGNLNSRSSIPAKSENPNKIGDVVIHCDVKQKETVVMVQQGDTDSYTISHIPVSGSCESIDSYVQKQSKESFNSLSNPELNSADSNSQESSGLICSQESNESALESKQEGLDTSLTNIQWLGGIQLKNAPKTEKDPAKPPHNSSTVQWKRMSTADILRIAAECGRTKRPPFSYMTLIQMALHSKEDKRMRLRDICAWIENTFPYYKHTAKPGWRNSIRHNLSLYSIFERETTKKHGSYWTVREDCPEKLKSCPVRDTKKDDFTRTESPSPFAGMIPVLPSFLPQNTNSSSVASTGAVPCRKRAGPQPILPRPSPVGSTSLQTYALIPIQNVGSAASSPNVVLPLSSSQESTNSTTSETSQNENKGQKTRRIAPKLSPSLMMSPPNLVKQAWMDAQFVSSSEGEGDKFKGPTENRSDNETCPKKAKSGLPQPQIYSKNTQPVRRTKSRRKQKLIPKERELMQDSSDEEAAYAKFFSRLEEELPTPMRQLLDENSGKNEDSCAITSTPLKSGNSTSQMPSPFAALTPLKSENILDNSFLECLRDSPKLTSKKSPSSSGSSPKLDFNFIGFTPVKSEHGTLSHDNSYNLSRFLAEYPIDANMMDDADVLPVDLSALNWSGGQNIVQLDNS